MMAWWREYKKLNEELEEAKTREATTPDIAAEETVVTTAPNATAEETVETTAPEITAQAAETKARKVAFKEPSDHGSADES